jgi:hypothetical protein
MHLYKKNIEKTARKNPTIEAIEHIDYIYKETFPEIPQAKVANYTFY